MSDESASVTDGNGGIRVLLALAWPITALLGVIFLSASAVVVVALIQTPNETVTDLTQIVASGRAFQRMLTLLIVIPALVVLALTGKAPGAMVVTAISGIAGFVMGTQVAG